MKIMASGPITSWEIDWETVETMSDFIFGGSKNTADSDCSHEIKRCLLLGRIAMSVLDSVLKSRDITLLTKVRLVKAGLEETQAGIKIAGRNINNLRYADDTTLWQKVKRN